VLLPDGRVLFVPDSTANIGIFDPSSDTPFSETIAGGTGSFKYYGGVLLPDGRVVFAPLAATNIGIVSGFPPVPIDRCLHPCFNKF